MATKKDPLPPRTTALWRKLWPKDDQTDRTTQTQAFGSASKFTLENFLSLRVLRNKISLKRYDPTEFGLDQKFLDEANRMLSEYNSWKAYCDSFKGKGKKKPKEGNFFLVKLDQDDAAKVLSEEVSESVISSPANHTRSQEQKRALREEQDQTPTKPKARSNTSTLRMEIPKGTKNPLPLRFKDAPDELPKTPSPREYSFLDWSSPDSPDWTPPDETVPPSTDETIVNAALVNFLKAITEYFDLSQHWTLHRKAFVASVTKGTKKEKLYEARTDGYLTDENMERVRALIEVKAAVRRKNELQIFMQESAQMAAWILEQPNEPPEPTGRRFQVLQDRHEIFINFAKYGDKYLSYLKGEEAFEEDDQQSFMTISEVGPFRTGNLVHMKKLVPILLALTLRAVEDEKQEAALAAKEE